MAGGVKLPARGHSAASVKPVSPSRHGPPAPEPPIIYGRNVIAEALTAGRVRKLSVSAGAGGKLSDLVAAARAHGVPVVQLEQRDIDRLAPNVNHQGVIAETAPYEYASLDSVMAAAAAQGEPPFLLLLDCIQDPQNLGSLLRTAEAVGVHGVVLPRHHAAEVTPAVEKASAGAVEHLAVVQETNLTQVIERLKRAGLWIAGLEADDKAIDYRQASLTGPLALVVGSEGKGISRLVRESCDFLVRLPMRGKVTSLNASVAGSIVLYEAYRQRMPA